MAISGDRIVALGAERDVLDLRGRRTRVIDLRNRTVLPGFTDAHTHPISGGLRHVGGEPRVVLQVRHADGLLRHHDPAGDALTGRHSQVHDVGRTGAGGGREDELRLVDGQQGQ